jgi:hypothetical protein
LPFRLGGKPRYFGVEIAKLFLPECSTLDGLAKYCKETFRPAVVRDIELIMWEQTKGDG